MPRSETSKVSCPQLDALVDAAAERRARGGVIGARLTGAGFGGCVVILCRRQAAGEVSRALADRYAERFGSVPSIFEAAAAGAARTVNVS